MTAFACQVRPDWVCLVPEKRQEVTTEGGLKFGKSDRRIGACIRRLNKAGILVSLFIEPSESAVRTSHELGADAVEIHTGRYCLAAQGAFGTKSSRILKTELQRIENAAHLAQKLGLRAHAGHGFDYENVKRVLALKASNGLPLIEEYNIGHVIVCHAALVGLEQAVREMRQALL